MIGILTNILITATTIFATTFGIYNFVPLSWFEFGQEGKLGSTLTTITGSTKVSDLDTILTTNFNALNNDKIENSTTSVAAITTLSNLVTVGTLTSGSLGSGFTTVVVARGGTGSTTLSANQVLLGNGTGNIGTVVGWGSSGQGLLSNGGALAPTWQAITTDQTANYHWTGLHDFNATTTFNTGINATGTTQIKNLKASSTVANPIFLNTVAYSTPSSQGSSGTFLKNDGTGALTWAEAGWVVIASTVATGTVEGMEVSFPAHDLIWVRGSKLTATAGITPQINFNDDYNANYDFRISTNNGAFVDTSNGTVFSLGGGVDSTNGGGFDMYIENATTSQKMIRTMRLSGAQAALPRVDEIYVSWDSRAQVTKFIMKTDTPGQGYKASSTITVLGRNIY